MVLRDTGALFQIAGASLLVAGLATFWLFGRRGRCSITRWFGIGATGLGLVIISLWFLSSWM